MNPTVFSFCKNRIVFFVVLQEPDSFFLGTNSCFFGFFGGTIFVKGSTVFLEPRRWIYRVYYWSVSARASSSAFRFSLYCLLLH